jgi:hypothetical protein
MLAPEIRALPVMNSPMLFRPKMFRFGAATATSEEANL